MKLTHILPADSIAQSSKYVVELTEAERETLQKLTHTGKAAARTLHHAWILLKADEGTGGTGWPDTQIAATFGVSLPTIRRVRRAFVERGLTAALERQRSITPRPTKIDGEAEAKLIAAVCGAPPAGHARWTLRLIADRFVELVGGEPVSYETIRRVLKKKRAQAVANEGVVYAHGREWSVRGGNGRCAGGISPPG